MGAGIFLLCALELLEKYCLLNNVVLPGGRQPPTRAELANCIYGVDIDPIACQVSSLAIWLYCSNTNIAKVEEVAANHFATNLRCADTMLSTLSTCAGWASGSPAANLSAGELFLWDQEFPEVFSSGNDAGFDAVISNPPWELAKPNSQEFFSATWPNFRRLSKQEALVQTEKLLGEQPTVNEAWQVEVRSFKKKSQVAKTRSLFQAQGNSDLNIYKLFLDLGFSLLRDGGCLAMLVPAGILVDKGALALRRRFLTQGKLFRVLSFINSDKTFRIHPSFTYTLIGVEKGGATTEFSASFGNTNSAGLNASSNTFEFTYQQKDIQVMSPTWLTIFDVSHPKDLEVLKKLHQSGILLGSRSTSNSKADWHHAFRREFDMTIDSHLFTTVEESEIKNYRQDMFGNWLKGNWQTAEPSGDRTITANIVHSADYKSRIKIADVSDVLLPLYEGRMVGQFDYSEKCHVEGSGRTATWARTDEHGLHVPRRYENFADILCAQAKRIRPHHLVALRAKKSLIPSTSLKVGYLAVGSATNVRTMLASALYLFPCGNSVPVLEVADGTAKALALTACLNSFVFDYALRMRMTGNNLNYFILQECPMPDPIALTSCVELNYLVASLNLMHPRNSQQWLDLQNGAKGSPRRASFSLATSTAERQLVRAVIDALVANAYGLTEEEFSWMLRGCDLHPTSHTTNGQHGKGFWRAGKTLPAEMRLPVMAGEAFRLLKENGQAAVLAQSMEAGADSYQLTANDLNKLQLLSDNLQNILAI